jgi:hypothetical protein
MMHKLSIERLFKDSLLFALQTDDFILVVKLVGEIRSTRKTERMITTKSENVLGSLLAFDAVLR